MYESGDRGDLTMVLMIVGLMSTIGAALVTAILALAVRVRKRRG
jgi:hypothetical protein